MTDQEILEVMGVSEAELSNLSAKYNEFLNSLNDKQRRLFMTAVRTKDQSAAELGKDVTPEQLEDFMRRHTPERGICLFTCRVFFPEPPHRHHPRETS